MSTVDYPLHIMPQKPPKPCKAPACPFSTRNKSGFCEGHKHLEIMAKREYERRRPSAHIRGYNYKWQTYRKQYLKDHPLCKTCEDKGEVKAAIIVDHIIPHRGDQVLFWDPNNHQGQCKICHGVKTADEIRADSGGQFKTRTHKGGEGQSLVRL